MKSKITLLFIFCAAISYAQNNTVASGGDAAGSSGSVAYTVGQISYETISNSSGSISQGIQQPFEIFELTTDEMMQPNFTMLVFPNPVVNNLTIRIEETDWTDLTYHLYDLQGRIVSNGNITQSEFHIEMNHLPKSVYVLRISKQNQTLKSFKIIKN